MAEKSAEYARRRLVRIECGWCEESLTSHVVDDLNVFERDHRKKREIDLPPLTCDCGRDDRVPGHTWSEGCPDYVVIDITGEPAPAQHALYQDTDPHAPYYDPDPRNRPGNTAGDDSDG